MSYVTGNPGRLIDLQWFAEEPLEGLPAGEPAAPEPPAPASAPGPALPPGKAPTAPAPGPGKPAAAKKMFHTFISPDGRAHEFESPEALNEAMKSSFMSQKSYSKKTADLATQISKIRAREAELEKTAGSQKEMAEKFKGFKQFMESRPDTFQRFAQEVRTPPSPEESYSQLTSLLDERFKGFEEKLAPFNDFMAQQAFDRDQNSVFETLSGEMPDMDRAEVEELMQTLAGDNVGLTRAMAHALQYRKGLQPGSPEEQQRLAEIAASKRNGRMIPGGSPPAAKVRFKDNEEAKRQGLLDAQAQGLL